MAEPKPAVEMAELVEQHHASVYRYAYRLTSSPVDAEDVTQQTFVTAQRHLGQLRSADAARAWLLAICRNQYLKSRRRQRPSLAVNLELDLEAVAQPVPDVSPVDAEQLQVVLDSLPDALRMVLLLFYFENLSYKQIGAELELPVGTVMSRLSRAKAQLRKRLSTEAAPEVARSSTDRSVVAQKSFSLAPQSSQGSTS